MKYVCSCCGKEFSDADLCCKHEDGCVIACREVTLSFEPFCFTSEITLKPDDGCYPSGRVIMMRTRVLTPKEEKKLKLAVLDEGKKQLTSTIKKCQKFIEKINELKRRVNNESI